jgi:NAD(P)-dependent dehydrogenase (short-subunit alcohol dehydrogenase family)
MSIALVTGANRGIGLSLCRLLKKRGDTVVAACRKSSPDLEELGVQVEVGVDVASDESVRALAKRIEGTRLDLLVNNAGIMERHSLDSQVLDSMRRQFEVNAIGPMRVTAALIQFLQPGAKIAIITSRMGSIADNTSGGSYGYRMSKAAVNMAGVSLARDLSSRQIAVALIHPGFVKTELTGNRGEISAEDAALGVLARIDALTLGTSGGFWHANGERLPW